VTVAPPTLTVAADEILVTIFGRLFENEFATLDGIAISRRAEDGIRYLDDSVAIARLLGETPPEEAFTPADPAILALHEAMHDAAPGIDTVVSGWSRHLRALLLEGMAPPASTSMLRNRGIADLGQHIVEPEALAGPGLERAIDRARHLADERDMRHLMLISRDGYVVAAGTGPWEVMAHWHNVEFAARVECLRVDEVFMRSASDPPGATDADTMQEGTGRTA
jgi:hypothetical protein